MKKIWKEITEETIKNASLKTKIINANFDDLEYVIPDGDDHHGDLLK